MKGTGMRKSSLALFALSLGLLVPAFAFGSTKTIHDPQGDVKGSHVDIASATAVATSTSVTWTINAYGDFTTPKAPCLSINRGAKQNPPGNEFEVCGTGVIYNFKHGGTSGKAKVSRPSTTSIVYTIRAKKFGSAKAVSWRIGFDTLYAQGTSDCKKHFENCDQAPNAPGKFIVNSL
jgi:hypothetical protein